MAPGPPGSESTEMEAPSSVWISRLGEKELARGSMKYTKGIRLSGRTEGINYFLSLSSSGAGAEQRGSLQLQL